MSGARLLTLAVLMGGLGCATGREVWIPVRGAPAEGLARVSGVTIDDFQIDSPAAIDAGQEAARFLANELRARTALEVGENGSGAGPRLRLSGRGRFEQATSAVLGSRSLERDTLVPEAARPDRRPRWAYGYTLVLDLELVASDESTGPETRWRKAFRKSLPPSERSGPLHGLYELLEPVADALVVALAGEREDERRELLLP